MAVSERPTFELEEFYWQSPDRLEITGKWRGIERTRLRDPVLMIAVAGKSRTLAALAPRSSAEPTMTGHRWRATFRYAEDPAHITGAELRVAPGVAVALPLPISLSSATRHRFGRQVLDVRSVEDEAGSVPARAEAEPSSDAVARARAKAARLQEEAARERTMHLEETRRLRQELDAARTSSARLSAELERYRDAHAAGIADIQRMADELRAMTESRDQLRAQMRLETEQLRKTQEGLERARRKEAEDVERLSDTVRAVRAAIERLALDHRATVRRLTENFDSALDRVEALAAESGDHADKARRELDDHAPHGTAAIVRDRLDVIAEQTRELTAISRALRRRAARVQASGDPGSGAKGW
jgi:hypothetical protein